MAAKRSIATRAAPASQRAEARARKLKAATPPAGASGGSESDLMNGVIHHRIRLGIVSALAGAETLSFNELKALFELTDGNLSVHARKLEDAKYIECRKFFQERRPRTDYRLTALGRKALQRYLDHMEALIHAARITLEK